MKYYEMVEPYSATDSTPEFHILSEEEIVQEYSVYYCLMYLTRLGYLPTRQQIIDEWCAIHWATEIL